MCEYLRVDAQKLCRAPPVVVRLGAFKCAVDRHEGCLRLERARPRRRGLPAMCQHAKAAVEVLSGFGDPEHSGAGRSLLDGKRKRDRQNKGELDVGHARSDRLCAVRHDLDLDRRRQRGLELRKSTRRHGGDDGFGRAAQDINVGARLSKTQYQFTLVDVDNDELNHWATILLQKLSSLPALSDVASDQQSAGQTIKIEVDRDVASRMGIDPAVVDSLLYDAFGQRHVARIFTTLNQYYVILEVDPDYQLGPNALSRIYAKSASGTMTPLSGLATVSRSIAPLAINHQGQFPSVTLSFNLAPGHTIGEAVASIQQTVRDLKPPSSIATSFQGNAQAFENSLGSTPILIVAALIAVYLILGMLYESLIHPITIISTLPSAGLGALLTLMLVGRPLDVIGIIGIILLIGIVKKNGIMLVDFVLTQQREAGKTSEEAIHKACLLRFRPILMTTLCALLGGVPLMLGTGTGSEIRQPLGYAIVGGLLVSQLLTLFTTPIVYLYLDEFSGAVAQPALPAQF
jgi:multidrug efflux pump subunit AcrB